MLKLFKASFVIVLLFQMISCTIKDFEAPEFDKKIQLPLLNEIYYSSELADTTEDYMVFVESDTLLFSISNDLETEYVDEEDLTIEGKTEEFDTELSDELMIDSQEETTTVEVGDDLIVDARVTEIEQEMNQIEVNESGNAYAYIGILEFASEAIGEPVEPIFGEVVPPYYDFDAFNQDFTLFENQNFEYVTIDTGSVFVTFYNNTELSLSSELGEDFEMHFEFYTNGTAAEDNGTYLFTHYIDHVIGPGDTENIVIPFDGNTVYMTNYLKCFPSTDGSDGPINVDYDDSFEVTFAVGNMTITEANAEIEAASVDQVEGISLEDEDISIIEAVIDSCTGSIYLENQLPFTIDTLHIQFQELFTPGGQNLEILETDILSGNSLDIPLDLQDHFIESQSGNPLDSLSLNVYASTDPPSGYHLISQEDMVAINIDLSDMLLQQFTGIIDQISEEAGEVDISDEDIQIQSAVIASGTLDLDLTGIDISDPSTITISFEELLTPAGEPLDIVIDQFDNYQYDLSQHQLLLTEDQMLNYQTSVHLNQEITLNNTDIVNADIVISELYFESVTGIFASFEIEDMEATEVDSSGEFNLFYAEIYDCLLEISIPEDQYTLPFGATAQISFQELFNSSGEALDFTISCPGDTIIDLSGYSLGNDPDSETMIDSLHYQYTVITESSGSEYTTLYNDQQVEAEINISDIILLEVIGIINNKTVELEDITEEIDLEDLPDSLSGLLEFQAVELHLNVSNQTGFDCTLTMDISASNADGNLVEIEIDETIYANAETEIVISDGINEMLDLIPDQINITNIVASVGDGETPGTIALNDSISGFYEVVSPLQFIVNDHTITESPDAIELDDDDQDTIEDNLTSVTLTIETENKLPIGVDMKLFFSTDSLLLFTDPGLVIDSLFILPATIVDGLAVEPSQNQFEIDLAGTDFDVFLDRENQDVYPGIELQILGTNGEVVTILGNDYINIIGYLEAIVHIAEEED